MKKKFLVFLTLMFTSISLFADANQKALESFNEQGGLIGGTTGIGIIHGTFWLPILSFFVVAGVIVGVYYKMFKQKDDGAFKTVAAFAVAIVLGVIVYISALKLVDKMFDADGCGGDIVTAYMKDSVKKGLNPGQPFGQTIKGLSCIQ